MPESVIFLNPACPHLPDIQFSLPITHTRAHRNECCAAYFQACLELAQSLWRSGFPAQAVLQLDKSFMVRHPKNLPLAYHAIIWLIKNTPEDQFLGNPVRHFQHLASRMNMKQPNAELRIWRAWICFHLAELSFPTSYSRDHEQITCEELTIPSPEVAFRKISELSDQAESEILKTLLF